MTKRKIVIRFCNNIRRFSYETNKRGGWIFFCGGWYFSKSVRVDSTFIREMSVLFSVNAKMPSNLRLSNLIFQQFL